MTLHHTDGMTMLARAIHEMRYDKVAVFYQHSAVELQRQAESDRARGRPKLAIQLDAAAVLAQEQARMFTRIWALCEPHMKVVG